MSEQLLAVVEAFLRSFHLTMEMGARVRFCLFACVCVCVCVCVCACVSKVSVCVFIVLWPVWMFSVVENMQAGMEVPSEVIVPSIY